MRRSRAPRRQAEDSAATEPARRRASLSAYAAASLVVTAWLLAACPPPPAPPPSPDRGATDLPPRSPDLGFGSPLLAPDGSCAKLLPASVAPAPLRLAGLRLLPEKDGFTLAPKTIPRWASRRLILGLVGDPRQALPGTVSALRRLRRLFVAARADAIVVLGGLPRQETELRAVLRALAPPARPPQIPLLVLPGSRSSRPLLARVLAELGPQVVNLAQVRIVRHPAATLLSLPGSPYARPTKSFKPCFYANAELPSLASAWQQQPEPRVLLGYVPPRGRGADAIDEGAVGVHSGSAALRRAMRTAGVRFGFFAAIREASGRATTETGSPVPEQAFSDSLLLNVGSVDALPEPAEDGRWLRPQGALVELRGGRARYRLLSLPGASLRALAPPQPPGQPSL